MRFASQYDGPWNLRSVQATDSHRGVAASSRTIPELASAIVASPALSSSGRQESTGVMGPCRDAGGARGNPGDLNR